MPRRSTTETGRPRARRRSSRRYDSLEAQVGAAIAAWPSGTVGAAAAARRRRTRRARSSRFHLGLALYWARHDAEAAQAWRAAARLEPDSLYAVRAADFLHPSFAPGLPTFVPSFEPPLRDPRPARPRRSSTRSPAPRRGDGAHAKILYGVALQRLDRPRLRRAAVRRRRARLAPSDPEALAAAAVGRFDKANPSAAFSRLGPLVRVFPHAQTVRFHLGLLLLWIGQVKQARDELEIARSEAPKTHAWTAGRGRIWTCSRRLGPIERKMSRSAYGVRPGHVF